MQEEDNSNYGIGPDPRLEERMENCEQNFPPEPTLHSEAGSFIDDSSMPLETWFCVLGVALKLVPVVL